MIVPNKTSYKSVAKMQKAVTTEELKSAFEEHTTQTRDELTQKIN